MLGKSQNTNQLSGIRASAMSVTTCAKTKTSKFHASDHSVYSYFVLM